MTVGLGAMAQKTSELRLGAIIYIPYGDCHNDFLRHVGTAQMIHKYYAIRDDRVKRGTVISAVFSLIIAGGGYFIGSLSRLFFNELPAQGRDYLVPRMLESAGVPDILLGLVLVLLISASVSTLTALTITASSTLTMDFIQARLFPNLSPEKSALITKGICGVFIALSYVVANSQTPILDDVLFMGNYIRQLPCAVHAFALLEGFKPRRGVDRNGRRVSCRGTAGGVQAVFSECRNPRT